MLRLTVVLKFRAVGYDLYLAPFTVISDHAFVRKAYAMDPIYRPGCNKNSTRRKTVPTVHTPLSYLTLYPTFISSFTADMERVRE